MKEKTRPKAQIVVIDDHPVLRDGLMQLLGSQPDLECTGTADNTADARRLVAQSAPDLMILDLRLKSGDTLDLIKSLQVEHPQLKVLVLSQYDEMLFAGRWRKSRPFRISASSDCPIASCRFSSSSPAPSVRATSPSNSTSA